MTQCNTLNVKLSNSHIDKLKSAIKNWTEVTLNLSSNLIWNSNDKTNFPHRLLLLTTLRENILAGRKFGGFGGCRKIINLVGI